MFSPSTRRISRSLMKRVAAIQKSSRTMTIGLDVLAVAMPQGRDQLGVGLRPPGEEPLLELVEDEEDLLAGTQRLPPPQRRERLDQAEPRGQVGATLRTAFKSRDSVSSGVAST